MVCRSPNDMRRRSPEERYIPAVVVKAARVWIELKAAEDVPDSKRWMTWRMRRDTQDEATQYSGSNNRFVTLDQHAWEETRSWARAVLRDNGIDLRGDSPWRNREVELADILAKASPSDVG